MKSRKRIIENKRKLDDVLNDYLEDRLHTSFEDATAEQIYKALARIVNRELQNRYVEFKKKKNQRYCPKSYQNPSKSLCKIIR